MSITSTSDTSTRATSEGGALERLLTYGIDSVVDGYIASNTTENVPQQEAAERQIVGSDLAPSDNLSVVESASQKADTVFYVGAAIVAVLGVGALVLIAKS